MPRLKRPLSILLGTPMDRICRSIFPSGLNCLGSLILKGFFFDCRKINMITAAAALDIKVGIATPSTPIPSPNTHRALPAILVRFIPRDTSIESRVFPLARKTEAEAWYMARKGYEAAVYSIYVTALLITSGSTLPNRALRRPLPPRKNMADSTSVAMVVSIRSCPPTRDAPLSSFAPQYLAHTTVPPAVMAKST